MKRLTEPFGKAGLTVAVIALVFAMLGGAYAAGTLTSKQKKEVEKIAKKYAGKPGAQGPAGPQGPAGAGGKDGAKGDTGASGGQGEKGLKGDTGNTGEEGASIFMVNEAPPSCPEGGFTYEVEGSGEENEICNGEKGEIGSFGGVNSELTGGAVLGSGDTEVGGWQGSAPDGASIYASLHLPTPINNEDLSNGAITVSLTGDEDFSTNCPGTFGLPDAEPGFFCIYVAKKVNTTLVGFSKFNQDPVNVELPNVHNPPGPVGGVLGGTVSGGAGYISGAWAVTAPLAGP